MRNGNVALFQLSTLHWTPNDEDDDRSPFILPRSDLDRTTKVPLRRRWWWCDNELENLCRFVTSWNFASFFRAANIVFLLLLRWVVALWAQISKANGRRGHWCVTISDRDKKQQNLPAKRVWYEKLRNFDCGIHRQSRDHHWDMFLSSPPSWQGLHCWRPSPNANGWKWEKRPRRKNAQFAECLRDFIATLLAACHVRLHLPLHPLLGYQSSSSSRDLLTIDDQRQSNREQPCASTRPRSVSQLSQLIRLLSAIPAQAQSPRRRSPRFELYVLLFIIIYLYIYLCSTHIV